MPNPWPDKKALQGFRSKAQSRWAHATDQWWADEYEKHTNYQAIPDKVTEDIDEGIENWGMPINEQHPVVDMWNTAITELENSKSVEEFENASKKIFKIGRIWDSDKNLKNQKIVSSFVGQYTRMLNVVKKWIKKADEISDEIKEKWELFIEKHGDPKSDVWEPWEKTSKKTHNNIKKDIYNWGVRAGKEVSEDVAEWINFNLSGESHNYGTFLKGLFRGVIENMPTDDAITAIPVNENALIRKVCRHTGLDKKFIEEFWSDSIKEQNLLHSSDDRKGKNYWAGVVEKFKNKVHNLDILEAKRIMTDRKTLRQNIDTFVTELAQGNYAQAQSVIPDMVKNQLGTMINRKKEAYLKELGKQVKERAKEA